MGDGWNDVWRDTRRAVGGAPIVTSLYFIALLFVANYTLLNLFVALLLGSFDGGDRPVSK